MTGAPQKVLMADGGLNTSSDENGLPLGQYVDLTNVILGDGGLRRRDGMVRVARASNANLCANLNGTSEIVTVPVNTTIHTLRKQWRVSCLVAPDTVNAARTLLGWAHATDWPIQIQFTSSAKVEVKVTDSAGTVVTMTGATTLVGTTTYAVDVVRNGTALTVYLNGVSEQTGTMADLDCKAPGGNLYFGRNNTGEFFDGKYEHCWAVNSADTYMGDVFLRCIHPRAENVLWSYVLEDMESTTHRIDDDSRFGNHGSITAGFSTATSIARQTMPVSMIAPYTDKNAKQRIVVAAGPTMRLAEIGV